MSIQDLGKVRGDTGNSGFNKSLGSPNPKPPAGPTPGKSLKNQGVTKLNTRLPYNSSRGEIRDHSNRG